MRLLNHQVLEGMALLWDPGSYVSRCMILDHLPPPPRPQAVPLQNSDQSYYAYYLDASAY